jgi:hypothetical protein
MTLNQYSIHLDKFRFTGKKKDFVIQKNKFVFVYGKEKEI